LANPAQCSCIDDQIGKPIEIAYRIDIAHLGALDPQLFGLTVDALGVGALVVDGMRERAVPIKHDAHLPTQFPVEVLDTARPFFELLVLTAGSCGIGMQQRTEEALTAVATRMRELEGGDHAQAFLAQGDAIAVALALGMAMLVESNGRDASPMHHRLVNVAGIKSRIRGDMGGKEAQGRHGADVEGQEVGAIALVEGQGVFGQHHLARAADEGTGHPRTIPPEVLLLFFFAAIGLLTIGALLDPQLAIAIASRLLILLEALFDVDP
jgi:hypothetical protein